MTSLLLSAPSPNDCAVFGFEGRLYNALDNIDFSLPSSILIHKSSGMFISDTKFYPAYRFAKSPMLRDDINDFAGSSYQISTKSAFIPDNNTAGLTDSIFISSTGVVSSMRVFTLIEHPSLKDIAYTGAGTGVTLISPTGISITLVPNSDGGAGKDLMTIFDMSADSTIKFNFNSPYCTSPNSPKIKPANSFAAFIGQQKNGWWKLKIADGIAGGIGYLYGWGLQIQTITGVENPNQLAEKFELGQNYPNPFNPSTVISYQLAVNSFVTLKIIDLSGREIMRLVNTKQEAGHHSVIFDGVKLSSGIYFYKLEAEGFTETKKMILLK